MVRKRYQISLSGVTEDCCVLCKLSADDPDQYGEKVTLKEHKLTVHYFCLLMSSGVYQKGEENEGVCGFLVDDIKQEVRRSSRLTCSACKKKGASVGCSVRSCSKKIHFPCGKKLRFIFQFTDLFPSFCADHSPVQTHSASLDLSLPQSCSVCLDSIEPTLSYSLLKCPACHTSWFHRDCVQHQAQSAGLFFFRCTLCNNKESFQQEMLRMGIHIPERDASWELEEHAFEDLLEVYQNCDAPICLCTDGRTHSAKSGWYAVVRCRLCGSRGTHRKCSDLELYTTDWACDECTLAVDGKASVIQRGGGVSPEKGQRRSLLAKRQRSSLHSTVTCKRPSLSTSTLTSEELLQSLALQLTSTSFHSQPQSSSPNNPHPIHTQSSSKVQGQPSPSHSPHSLPPGSPVEVSGDQALVAGLSHLKRPDFNPTHRLTVRFKDGHRTPFPSSPFGGDDDDVSRRYFLKLLVEQIQKCPVFEGPDRHKNLALDAQALREDLYYDVGCLLALSLVHGGPPVRFFSPALFQCLFNHPRDSPLTRTHMTHNTHCTRQVNMIAEARSLEDLKEAVASCQQFLEVAGCWREISSLDDKEALVEDLVNFTMITRMQLPLQRLREGLCTLGVFNQVQLFPAVFYATFCSPADKLTAHNTKWLFTVNFSSQTDRQERETAVFSYWRHFLLECEVGRSSISLQDLLLFVSGVEEIPAVGLFPRPTIGFLHPSSHSSLGEEEEEERVRDEGRRGVEGVSLLDEGEWDKRRGGERSSSARKMEDENYTDGGMHCDRAVEGCATDGRMGGERNGQTNGEEGERDGWRDDCVSPVVDPSTNGLSLPVVSSYPTFKTSMELTVHKYTHMHG